MDLSELLHRLLRDHECVVITGFGGFVAQYRSAELKQDHTIRPPSRGVGFNPSLKSSDGVLLNELVRHGVNQADASERISRFANECGEKLSREKILLLPGLGKLQIDSEGAVRFVQSEDVNLLRDAFGLKILRLTPVLRRTERESESRHRARRIVRLAAAASVVLLLGTGTSLFFLNDSFHQTTLGLFHDVIGPRQVAEVVSLVLPIPSHESLTVQWDSIRSEMLESESEQNVENQAVNDQRIPAEGYHVIVGAFGQQQNAQRLLNQISSSYPDATTFKSRYGLVQVSIYASSEWQSALDLLAEVRASIEPEAWLYRE